MSGGAEQGVAGSTPTVWTMTAVTEAFADFYDPMGAHEKVVNISELVSAFLADPRYSNVAPEMVQQAINSWLEEDSSDELNAALEVSPARGGGVGSSGATAVSLAAAAAARGLMPAIVGGDCGRGGAPSLRGGSVG